MTFSQCCMSLFFPASNLVSAAKLTKIHYDISVACKLRWEYDADVIFSALLLVFDGAPKITEFILEYSFSCEIN